MRAMFVMLLSSIAVPAGAQVYKCVAGGQVSYLDRPCPHGVASLLPAPPAAIAAPLGAAGREAPLRPDRQQRAAQARAERESGRVARQQASQRRRCERLRLRARWAREDLAAASAKAADAARLRLRRQTELLAVECPD